MNIISGVAAAATIFLLSIATTSAARAADAWGCSYDKCLTVCAKASGGQRCSAYCGKALRDKQLAKVCKA